jgi:hypothetical protein
VFIKPGTTNGKEKQRWQWQTRMFIGVASVEYRHAPHCHPPHIFVVIGFPYEHQIGSVCRPHDNPTQAFQLLLAVADSES